MNTTRTLFGSGAGNSSARVGELLSNTLPVLATNLVSLAVGLGDLYVAGHLGPDTLSGISNAFVWFSMAQSFALAAYTIGVTRARALAGEQRSASTRVAASALLGAVAIGIVLAILLGASASVLARSSGLTGPSFEVASRFLGRAATAVPALFLLACAQGLLRGSGRPRAASRIVNGALAASFFVGAYLALPAGAGMAESGLAWGWSVATCVGAAVGVVFLIRSGELVSFRPGVLWRQADRRCVADILRIAYPAALVWGVVALTALGCQTIFASLGQGYLAAFGMVYRLETLVGVVASAFGAGALYCGSRRLAAGDLDGMQADNRIQQRLLLAAVAPLTMVLMLFPEQWPSLFTQDPAITAVTAANTRVFALGLPFMAMAQVASTGLIVLGRPLLSLSVVVLKNLVLMLPMMWIARHLSGPDDPIWVFVAQVAGSPLALLYARRVLAHEAALRTGNGPAQR